MQTLRVELPGKSYPIYIGAGILDEHLPQMTGGLARELVVVVTNETLARLYPGRIDRALSGVPARIETLLIPDGERFKTLETLSGLYDGLMDLGANRQTLIIAFGGGVVGDIAGFCAGTFMRGIPLIQVPTTILAQVDSSIGGKTGVNHALGKNAVGVFKQPRGVLVELEFLTTLSARERRAGMLELVKHPIIADGELFDHLAAHPERPAEDWDFWEDAILRSCRVKARVVEQDEMEGGLRAILNFGHTLGHLIETHTHYEKYLHGEAVGVGMLFAAYCSRAWNELSGAAFERVRNLLETLLTPVTLPPLDERQFISLLLHDKKAAAKTLRFIALRDVGQVFIREGTAPGELWPLFRQFAEDFPGICRVTKE